jgi:hypothetical protein
MVVRDDINSVLGFSHHVNMGHVADVSEVSIWIGFYLGKPVADVLFEHFWALVGSFSFLSHHSQSKDPTDPVGAPTITLPSMGFSKHMCT